VVGDDVMNSYANSERRHTISYLSQRDDLGIRA
jgi:hypothetical protein